MMRGAPPPPPPLPAPKSHLQVQSTAADEDAENGNELRVSRTYEAIQHIPRTLLLGRLNPDSFFANSILKDSKLMEAARATLPEPQFIAKYCQRRVVDALNGFDRRESVCGSVRDSLVVQQQPPSILGAHRSTMVGIGLSRLPGRRIEDLMPLLGELEGDQLAELARCLPTPSELETLCSAIISPSKNNDRNQVEQTLSITSCVELNETEEFMFDAARIAGLKWILESRRFMIELGERSIALAQAMLGLQSSLEAILASEKVKWLLALLHRCYELSNIRFGKLDSNKRFNGNSGCCFKVDALGRIGEEVPWIIECLLECDPRLPFTLHRELSRRQGEDAGMTLLMDLPLIQQEMSEIRAGIMQVFRPPFLPPQNPTSPATDKNELSEAGGMQPDALGQVFAKYNLELDWSHAKAFYQDDLDHGKLADCLENLQNSLESLQSTWNTCQKAFQLDTDGEEGSTPRKIIRNLHDFIESLLERSGAQCLSHQKD